jgi:hypothetical protein
MHVPDNGGASRLADLSTEWNATTDALEALWESRGMASEAEWRELSEPIFGRRWAIEDQLGPLLLEWAEASDLGRFIGGPIGWSAQEGCYRKIREVTGLKAHGNTIRAWLNAAGQEEGEKALAELVRSIADGGFDEFINHHGTVLRDGMATNGYVLRLRVDCDEKREGA